MRTFQEIILTLQRYWAEQGCLLWYPYHETVGAGTANPATALRVLGGEPWNVAYLEPSFRPDDGRYGDNPNRLQMHHQFQVIMKPVPRNPQDLYLGSLAALGIELEKNDVRFVEDNWESPALGAWGLGWEVWLNGMEVSQYTYFQQAGGRALDPPALELTYGLERLAFPLCGVSSVWDIPWNDRLSYRDVLHRAEVEHCIYDFEVADVERLRELFDRFEQEAEACLERGLVIPAHDQVCRCSHTFNLLDSRGAVGVTERAAFFTRMRNLSRRVADAYVAQREEMEFPFLRHVSARTQEEAPALPPVASDPATLLLEVGSEEIPVDDLDSLLAQLEQAVPKMLADSLLEHGDVRVLGTPRRLVVSIENLAPCQPDRSEVVKGPPMRIARDGDGNWTKAALGFAKKNGLAADQLEEKELDGAPYVVATVKHVGRSSAEVMCEALPRLLSALRAKKTMRWLSSAVDGEDAAAIAFSRPLRWLVCLLGDQVLPLEFATLVAGRTSFGLRGTKGTPAIEVASAETYFDAVAAHHVTLDPAVRRAAIIQGARELAAKVSGVIDEGDLEQIADEVTHMVERPTPFLANFEPEYLEVPLPVLVVVMKKHQRYFPVRREDGSLLPHFIGVRNGSSDHLEGVQTGNEEVIRARFADAQFFFAEDQKLKLEQWLPRLDTLTFHEKLGSFKGVSERLEKLSAELADGTALCTRKEDRETLARASHLSKADMVTRVVTEFPYLAGTMGAIYARGQGENEPVARCIEEQYLPAPGKRVVPETDAGTLLSLADKLDKLTGLFAIGVRPKGTADPYALRRDALGLIVLLLEKGLHLSLEGAVAKAAAHLPVKAEPDALVDTVEFITRRLQVFLGEQSTRADVVAAAVAGSADDPVRCQEAVRSLSEWVTRKDWEEILTAFARCVRLVRTQGGSPEDVDTAKFEHDSEGALWQQVTAARERIQAAGAQVSGNDILSELQALTQPINTFFDSVMVMAEDDAVKRVRLGMLATLGQLTEGFADLSQLEGF